MEKFNTHAVGEVQYSCRWRSLILMQLEKFNTHADVWFLRFAQEYVINSLSVEQN
jgi:hypothetical protein